MFTSLLLFAILAALVSQMPTMAASTGTTSTIQTGPPFLKLNDYTVLYLNPSSPHRDKRGTLIAPVKPLAALLGVSAKSTADGKTITLSGNGHTVIFTANGSALSDGKPLFLASKPTLWQGKSDMLVPVEAVAVGLGINTRWEKGHQVFQMQFDKALANQEDTIHSNPAVSITPDFAVSPVSFQMTIRSKPSGFNMVKNPRLTGMETEYVYRINIVLHNGNKGPIVDDSVIDVIDDEPVGRGADAFAGPTVGLSFGDSPVRNQAVVHPGQSYRYANSDSCWHPVIAVIIAGGSQTPAAYNRLKQTHSWMRKPQ